MTKNKNRRFYAALILFGLIGQVAWMVENMYFNVFIYNMFSASPADISLMVAASSVVATVTTVLIGALSDRVGKRRLFISLGYILWGASILLFALVRKDVIGALLPTAVSVSAVCVTVTVLLDCLMTFFGSTANDAAFNAWLTDAADPRHRGAVEGINAMMPLVAILVVFGGFMSFDLKEASAWTVIFIIIGGVVLVSGVAALFLVDEPTNPTASEDGYLKTVLYSFRPTTVKKNALLYATVLAFAVFGISIQIFMPYLIIYYEVALGMTDYVFVMAPAIVLASVATAFYGKVYDKLGFFRSALPALGVLALGYILLTLFRATLPVFLGSLLMMTGYLSGMAVFGAMLRDHIPEGKAGAFQGIRIVGQVLIPGIVGPAIGAFVLRDAEVMIGSDGTESFIPNESIFIAALAVAAFTALAVLLCRAVEKRKAID
ncbi:MAG: MFS transporter [Ruminococcaceae bacterium]|nr:MFS transporter [Oscillospiraceae bacterium]